MIRRLVAQPPPEPRPTPDDPEAELARRARAKRLINQRVDEEMRRISSPERQRCRLFGCVPTRRASAARTREPSALEQRVFGTAVKATPAESKLADAIAQLQTLVTEQESKLERAREHARSAYKAGGDAKQNKEALAAMKRAKHMEKRLDGLQGQLAMVERQRDTLEESQMQKKLVAALSQSAKAMKANGKLVKQAEHVADSAVEFFDQNEDISNALAQAHDAGDDDELLAELAELITADQAIEAALEVQGEYARESLPAPSATPSCAPSSTSLPASSLADFPSAPKTVKKQERAALLAAT